MTITINGSGTITGASTLATAIASPTLTTPTIDSAQFPTVSGSAPLYAARAWVNFNGTGTVAIRASGNVSSITDNATGNYRVNFTTAMPDANYSVNVTIGSTSTDSQWTTIYIPNTSNGGAPTTTSCGVNTGFVSGSSQGDLDPVRVNVAIFR